MIFEHTSLKPIPSPATRFWAPLLTALTVGIILRFYSLDREALWFDEALTLVISQWDYSELWFMGVDPTPPLYYTLFKAFFSDSIPSVFNTRLPSVIFGILSIPVFYGIAATIFGPRSGVFAVALFSISPIHIEYSQEARAYSLAFFLVCVSAYCLTVLLASNRHADLSHPLACKRTSSWVILYIVTAAASSYAHTISIFWVAGSGLLLFYAFYRNQAPYKIYGITLATFLVLHSLWIWHVLLQVFVRGGFSWLEQPTLMEAASTFVDTIAQPSIWRFEPFVQFALFALIVIGAGISTSNRYHKLLIVLFIVLPIGIWVAGFVKPLFLERTILVVIIGSILSITAVFARLPRLWGLAFAFAVFMIFGKATYNHFVLHDKQDWAQAADAIADNASKSDLVLLCRAASFPALMHQMRGTSEAAYVGLYHGHLTRLPNPGTSRGWLTPYFEEVYRPMILEHNVPHILADSLSYDRSFGVKAHAHCSRERHTEPFGSLLGPPDARKAVFTGTGVTVVRVLQSAK